MGPADELVQDVMQVCRNGHVITDLLRPDPGSGLSHCDRCGASTLARCPTCGRELPGAVVVPGLRPVGARQPPPYCAFCGAAFPWARQPRTPPAWVALARLEELLRRLPRVVRQLRQRQDGRPTFRVEDEKDLEDLARSLLPLLSDDVRPEGRTPRYAAGTRTDFLPAPERLALALKRARPGDGDECFLKQIAEDADYYRRRNSCRTLVVFVFDPEGVLRDPARLVAACARSGEEPEVRCMVGHLG